MKSLVLGLLTVAVAHLLGAVMATEADPTLGQRIRSFKLLDQKSRPVSLAKLAEGKVAVVAFIGTECPLVQLYGTRLCDLAKKYAAQGVVFLAIDSNYQDTKADIVRFVAQCDIEFPVLRDQRNLVADHFGAKRTPEVFVLDKERTVRYHGRIDDQYGIKDGVSFKRAKPERNDLATAIDEVLAGKTVSVPSAEAAGCLIGRAPKVDTKSTVTYATHIAAIFNKRCVECHRPGEVAPFSMAKYEDFAGWGDMIREVVNGGRMPPWHASPEHGVFKNDARLSDGEKQLILEWCDNGCPQGDPAKTPKPPRFAKNWQLPDRKQIFWMKADKKPFTVPADGKIDYQYFIVDPKFTEDKWVQAAEARAGDRTVVHHIIVFIEPPGKKKSLGLDGFLVATAPGARPMVLPEGMAKKIPAGSKLKFQMHYTPNGKPTKDLSAVALVYADPKKINTVVRTDVAANIIFRIPPKAENHPVNAIKTFNRDTMLVSLFPHMHLRGKSYRFTARYPGGKEEILLDIPGYDFNWQNTYELAEPKLLPKGTEIRAEARFDNSKHNPSNPDPNQTVTFGEQTWEEMMLGFMDVAVPREVDRQETLAKRARRVGKADSPRGGKSAAARARPPAARTSS